MKLSIAEFKNFLRLLSYRSALTLPRSRSALPHARAAAAPLTRSARLCRIRSLRHCARPLLTATKHRFCAMLDRLFIGRTYVDGQPLFALRATKSVLCAMPRYAGHVPAPLCLRLRRATSDSWA